MTSTVMNSNSTEHYEEENKSTIERFKSWWSPTKLDLDKFSHYVDQNILVIRYLPYAVGCLGIVVIFRSIRMATKFTKAKQIPRSFIRKHVQLNGRVDSINLDGTFKVEHLPIIPLPWHRLYRDSLLNVRLAFVSPSISGTYWMRLNMTNKPVKFQLIYRMNDTNQLLAIVRPYGYKLPKSMGTLNETLVRNGLASLNQSDNVLVSTKKQSRLLASLESCQTKAMKDGSGMWSINHKETLLESTKRMFDNMLNKLKSSRQ
ncbi:hypothetical protein BLOT_010568 [Blomia tropicalis]|nr:hypothetical protein BLOT_010568 [Blomia tropicalis]